jgi:protein-S-isoprenylcysteine O-methyltransferase Ste14
VAVGLQFALLLLLVWRPEGINRGVAWLAEVLGWTLLVVGGAVLGFAMLGLGSALSPFPSPKANAELETEGLYAWVRHPIYTGVLMAVFGWTLLGFAGEAQDPYRLIVALLLVLLFQWKAGYEEGQWLLRDPEYSSYMQRTGRFLPLFGKRKEVPRSSASDAAVPVPDPDVQDHPDEAQGEEAPPA